MSATGPAFDLERFVAAQDDPPVPYGGIIEACAELRAGRKRGHWIWWIVPQLRGLGTSDLATRYGISSLEEARAYVAHPVLGMRLRTVVDLLLALPDSDPATVLGAVDARKLGSSMTLFHRAAPDEPRFRAVLDRWFGGQEDARTLELLGADPVAGAGP